MKQYVIDGLRPQDHDRLETHLKTHLGEPELGNIFWMTIDRDHLTDLQASHTDCSPHVFALELDPDRISCELLVRVRTSVKCDCMAYATPDQREWLIQKIDSTLEELGILV